MDKTIKIGDLVSWNSESGRVSGKIIKEDNPQYEIRSDISDHIAVHKGSALTRIFPLLL